MLRPELVADEPHVSHMHMHMCMCALVASSPNPPPPSATESPLNPRQASSHGRPRRTRVGGLPSAATEAPSLRLDRSAAHAQPRGHCGVPGESEPRQGRFRAALQPTDPPPSLHPPAATHQRTPPLPLHLHPLHPARVQINWHTDAKDTRTGIPVDMFEATPVLSVTVGSDMVFWVREILEGQRRGPATAAAVLKNGGVWCWSAPRPTVNTASP